MSRPRWAGGATPRGGRANQVVAALPRFFRRADAPDGDLSGRYASTLGMLPVDQLLGDGGLAELCGGGEQGAGCSGG